MPPPLNKAKVTGSESGQRIDNYLLRVLKGMPRPRVYRLLRTGEVRVNSRRTAPSYRVREGDEVRFPPALQVSLGSPDAPAGVPAALRLQLAGATLYEDRDMLVIDKPAGLPSHGGSGLKWGAVELLKAIREGEDRHLELAHRLDRWASGCLVFARNRRALRSLHEAFRSQRVRKNYLALCAGKWPRKLTAVDAPVAVRVLAGGRKIAVAGAANGRASRTAFVCRRRYSGATLLEARPQSGRTHQIRVHAQWAGHPLAGDEQYGDLRFNQKVYTCGLRRLFLHATALSLPDAQGEMVEVRAPLPAQLEAVLARLDPA